VNAIIVPSGEKRWIRFDAGAGRQPAGIAAITGDDPEVAGVVEDDLGLDDGGERSSSGPSSCARTPAD